MLTVVLGWRPEVLPGFLSVDGLTVERDADLTPELLDEETFDLLELEDEVVLDGDADLDVDLEDPVPPLLACAKASD